MVKAAKDGEDKTENSHQERLRVFTSVCCAKARIFHISQAVSQVVKSDDDVTVCSL